MKETIITGRVLGMLREYAVSIFNLVRENLYRDLGIEQSEVKNTDGMFYVILEMELERVKNGSKYKQFRMLYRCDIPIYLLMQEFTSQVMLVFATRIYEMDDSKRELLEEMTKSEFYDSYLERTN